MAGFPDAANQQFSRWPTDIATALGSTFLPASLIFFIKNPAFYTVYGLHTMVVMAFAATMPIFILSLLVTVSWDLADKAEDNIEQEWGHVRAAGGMTAIVMYPAVIAAYYTRLQIATIFVGVAGLQIAAVLVAMVRSIAKRRSARSRISQRGFEQRPEEPDDIGPDSDHG